MIQINDYIKGCEQGLKVAKDIIVKSNFKRIVLCGTGEEIIPTYFAKSYIKKPNVPIFLNEGYADPEQIKHDSLVILISEKGNEEEILSNYRLANRLDAPMIVFNNSGKLYDLCRAYKEITHIEIPSERPYYTVMGFVFFSLITILKNSEVFEGSKTDLIDTLEYLKKTNITNLGLLLSKRIDYKMPLLYTTEKMKAVGKAWKILFNKYLNRRLFHSIMPMATYSDSHTYNNPGDLFYSVIVKDESDSRFIKPNFEELKTHIKKNGQDVLEVALSGNFYFLRLVSAYLMCVYCIDYLRRDEQHKLDDY